MCNLDIVSLAATFAVSFALSLVIVRTSALHGHLTVDAVSGAQKNHSRAIPRVGGLALAIGALAGAATFRGDMDLWWLLAACCLPAFVAGLWEDVSKRVGVRARLMATVLAGAAFAGASGYTLHHLEIWPVDMILGVPAFAVLFTGFAIGGVANAVNIIDGCNGLSAGTAMLVAAAFALISWQAGDLESLEASLVVFCAVAGFFMLNFPRGRIFLGDAGAYSIGFLLAALAVALPERTPGISPVIGLLLLVYPVTETIYSVGRRIGRGGGAVGQPDRLHLHSLVFQALQPVIGDAVRRNSASGAILWILPAISSVTAVFLARASTGEVLLAVAANVVLYCVAYSLAARAAQRASRTLSLTPRGRTAPQAPQPAAVQDGDHVDQERAASDATCN